MIPRIALAELRKAQFKKRFWVLLIIMGVITPLVQVIIAYFVVQNLGGTQLDSNSAISNEVAKNAATAFSLGRNFLSVGMIIFLLPISAMVGNYFIGEERGFKMWKVILVAQPNRVNVLLGKFFAGMMLLAILILGSGLGNMIIGFLANAAFFHVSNAGDWATMLALYGLQCLTVAAPLALAMLLSSIIAAPAMSLLGTILLPPIAEGIITSSILSQLQRVNVINATFQALKIKNLFEQVPRYFLSTNLNIGTSFAASGFAGGILGSRDNGGDNNPFRRILEFSWDNIWWSVGVSAVYATIFTILFIVLWRRRDVLD
jgi:ABC-type transport system involved in multi-copper enzyme maturation permease subunit